ncbi:MAG: hypothetical protein ACLU61_08375 [Lachnospiraceae bacterium]
MIFAANVFPALTGDESNAAMFIVIAVIAVIVVLVLAFKDRIFRTGKKDGISENGGATMTADQAEDKRNGKE